jgi:hypothetical protein
LARHLRADRARKGARIIGVAVHLVELRGPNEPRVAQDSVGIDVHRTRRPDAATGDTRSIRVVGEAADR